MAEHEGTLIGVVRPPTDRSPELPVLSDVRLMVDGEDQQRVKTLLPFELETDTGACLWVDAGRVELWPQREVDGRFGDLLDDPLAQAVIDVAPGDHVRVTLRGAFVHAGDRVHVEGTIGGDAGAPTHIAARALAVGPGAEALLRAAAMARSEALEAKAKSKPEAKALPQTSPPSSGPGLGLAVVLGATSIVAMAASGMLAPFDTVARLCGLILAAAALFVWRRRRWLPSLEPLGPPVSGSGLRWRVGPWIGLGMVVLVFAGSAAAFGTVSTSEHSADVFFGWAGPYALASFPLVLFGALVYSDAASMRRAILMLRAKPLTTDAANGRFGAFEGTSDEDVRVTWSYAMTTTESRTERRAEDGTLETSHSTSTSFAWKRHAARARRCTVSIGSDLLDVDLEGALFGADRRALEYPSKAQYLPGGHRTSSSSSQTVAHATLTEWMTPGDSVFVVGRVKREDGRIRLAAAGEESLFAFSAPTDARAVLRSHVMANAISLGSLVGLSAAGFALLLG